MLIKLINKYNKVNKCYVKQKDNYYIIKEYKNKYKKIKIN